MDRKARDLASGKKKLEEYKRKKQAKGAALRAQLDHDGISESAHEGPAFGAPPSPARSEATSDLTRNKYQDRLEARLASVLGNKTNAGAAQDAPDDGERGRLDERREKAIVAGRKLSDELAAARADIAAAKDLTAHAAAGDQTPGGAHAGGAHAARSPASTPGRDRDVPRAAPTAAPGREAAVDRELELRDRLRAEHAEVSRLRGELSALRAEERGREAETARLVAAEREARDAAEANAAEAKRTAEALEAARGETRALASASRCGNQPGGSLGGARRGARGGGRRGGAARAETAAAEAESRARLAESATGSRRRARARRRRSSRRL